MMRLSRSAAIVVPMAVTLFLTSCSSTGSNLDVAGTGLQAGLTSPLPTNPDQAANLQSAAPEIPDQGPGVGFAQAQNAPQPTGAQKPGDVKIASATEAQPLDQNAALIKKAAIAAENKAQEPNSAAPAQAVASATPEGMQAQPAQTALASAQTPAENATSVTQGTTETAIKTPTTAPATQTAAAPATATLTATPPEAPILTAAPVVAPAAPAKKKSLFDSLFASNKNSKNSPQQAEGDTAAAETQLALAPAQPEPKKQKASVEPVLQPAKLELTKLEPTPEASNETANAENGELPGVRKGALFEIKRRDSLDSEADVDIGETDSGPVLLASAGGLARLAPNGLRVQRQSVDVACLKPQLVKILKSIEQHYGSPVVVTSGFRSPGYNRRVRGAKNSLHMFCAAADIQVAGVGKWALAKYARSMPGRGGVGTYCHTDSIHIDVGPDRDWNWRCSRRK